MGARIIAIGQREAGDDAVALAVLDRLRSEKSSAADGSDRARVPGFTVGKSGCASVHQAPDSAYEAGVWSDVELCEAADATELIPLLQCRGPVILIDACVGSDAPGRVRDLAIEAIEADRSAPLSSHVLSVRQAIDLARTLYPERVAPCLRVVGIGIAPPERYATTLSPPVARAVPRAANAIVRILGGRELRAGRRRS